MLDFDKDREFYISERKRRALSVSAVSKQISELVHYEVSRDQLNNWEYKKSRPSVELWRGLECLLSRWRRENQGGGFSVQEEREVYQAQFRCERCNSKVPGPAEGASYCLSCGEYFLFQVCPNCKFVERRMDAQFCIQCGGRFAEEDSL